MSTDTRTYPRTVACDGAQVEIAHLSAADARGVDAFVAKLPAHDLLFLRRDLRHAKVRAAWMEALADGSMTSLVARSDDDVVVGCAAVAVDRQSWSAHVGELRVLVAQGWRGRGLGRALIQECFAVALGLGLKKLCAQMTVDQRAAIAVFEELGFRAEAVLQDQVMDRDGHLHDLALLGHDIARVRATMQAYGMEAALDG